MINLRPVLFNEEGSRMINLKNSLIGKNTNRLVK